MDRSGGNDSELQGSGEFTDNNGNAKGLTPEQAAAQKIKETAERVKAKRAARLAAEPPAVEPPHKWREPIEPKATLPPVLPMTGNMIPEPLRAWIADISHRLRCPADFVASAAIVMLSSLIGTRLTIKPKAYDDWAVVPNLWGASIGDPSTYKTPSMNAAFDPLKRLVAEAMEKYQGERETYESEKSTYEAQKAAHKSSETARLKGNRHTPVEHPKAPKRPTEKRYMTNDATVEKLGELLSENPAGLLQCRDELIGLLAGWDRAGREQDRAFYLEGWNGNGSVTVDRIGRGTMHIPTVCVSLYGGIQPAKLTPYLQAATGYENDGFIQRLQVAVYPDKEGWGYIDQHPDKEARDTASATVRAIAEADLSLLGYGADEYNRYPHIRFDAGGQQVFRDWLTHWKTQVEPRETGLLLEHFAKYPSLMPSLALVFHVISYANGLTEADPHTGKHLVSAEAAQMAVKWIVYLATHTRRIYGLLDTAHVEAARDLLRHIKKGDLSNGFKARDVVRKGWSQLTEPALVQSAIGELVQLGWLCANEPEASTTGRPEAESYTIHPNYFLSND